MAKRKAKRKTARAPAKPKAPAPKMKLIGRTVTERYGVLGALSRFVFGRPGPIGSLGASSTRHAELAKFHSREAIETARYAAAKAKVGKCAQANEQLVRAAIDYGRADAHAAAADDASVNAKQREAREAVNEAGDFARGCLWSATGRN